MKYTNLGEMLGGFSGLAGSIKPAIELAKQGKPATEVGSVVTGGIMGGMTTGGIGGRMYGWAKARPYYKKQEKLLKGLALGSAGLGGGGLILLTKKTIDKKSKKS